ncbi:MAG: hypothetical protein NE334_17825 [Lentisphaeraceae bacterium]|nr:hypothetical protein [Lentisphaeraceae bacterium]
MQKVNAILNVYHLAANQNVPTVKDHISCFEKHSEFEVYNYNTALPVSEKLYQFEFAVIIFHYTVMTADTSYIPQSFLEYMDRCQESYKIVFIQDEHYRCQNRFAFLNRFKIDCLYTLMEKDNIIQVYSKHTSIKKIQFSIPGYVSDELVNLAQNITQPMEDRTTDIGYRGRKLDYYMGKGSQEKFSIAHDFEAFAKDKDLILDLATKESERIYGNNWFKFIANCKAFLGVESGVSIFDTDGTVYQKFIAYNRYYADLDFDGFSELTGLNNYEDNIYYRTISPRHFECAALKVCQILFEGKYSGIMRPWEHYIPLKKDFSNIDEVISAFNNLEVRERIVNKAYQELVESGKYHYANFIRNFDQNLTSKGYVPSEIEPALSNEIKKALEPKLTFNPEQRDIYQFLSADEKVGLHYEAVQQLKFELENEGVKNIALYGAGKHTEKILSFIIQNFNIVAIYDDYPRANSSLLNIPILNINDLDSTKIDKLVLSSDNFENQMLKKKDFFNAKNVSYITIYQNYFRKHFFEVSMKFMVTFIKDRTSTIFCSKSYLPQVSRFRSLSISKIICPDTEMTKLGGIPILNNPESNLAGSEFALVFNNEELQHLNSYNLSAKEKAKIINMSKILTDYSKFNEFNMSVHYSEY